MNFVPGDKVTLKNATMVGEVKKVAQLSFTQSDCVSRAVVYVRWPTGSLGRHVEGQLKLVGSKVVDVVKAEIARGAAPALATNQTIRELIEAEGAEHSNAWDEGSPPEAATCDACGTKYHVSDAEVCGGCGFTWDEIAAAVKAVHVIGKALGVDIGVVGEDRLRAAVDAALGEMVPE